MLTSNRTKGKHSSEPRKSSMNKEHNVDDTGMPAESDRNAWRKEMGRALEQRPNHLIQQHHQLANQCSPLEWRNSSNEQFPLPSPYYQYEMVSAAREQAMRSDQEQQPVAYSSTTSLTLEQSNSFPHARDITFKYRWDVERMDQSHPTNAEAEYDTPPHHQCQSYDYQNDLVACLTNLHGLSFGWHQPHLPVHHGIMQPQVIAPPCHEPHQYAWQEHQEYHDNWYRSYPHQRSSADEAFYSWYQAEMRNSTDCVARNLAGTEVTDANTPSHSHSDASDIQRRQKKAQKRKKDRDEPKRPLTAYNIFFRDERARMLETSCASSTSEMKGDSQQTEALLTSASTTTIPENLHSQRRKRKRKPHGMVGFEEMARRVSRKWHEASDDTKEKYQGFAEEDRHRYDREKAAYLMRKNGLAMEKARKSDSHGCDQSLI